MYEVHIGGGVYFAILVAGLLGCESKYIQALTFEMYGVPTLVSSRSVHWEHLQTGKVKEEVILLKLSWDSSRSVDMTTAVIAVTVTVSIKLFGLRH